LKPQDAIYRVLLDYNDRFVGVLANRIKQQATQRFQENRSTDNKCFRNFWVPFFCIFLLLRFY